MSGSGYGGQLVALDVNNQQPNLATPLLQAGQIQGQNLQNQQSALQLGLLRNRLALGQQFFNASQGNGNSSSSQSSASQSPLAHAATLAANTPAPTAAQGASASPLAGALSSDSSGTPVPATPVDPIATAAQAATDANSWDRAFSKLADGGNAEAGQYVGRFTPQLQSRLQQVYGISSPQQGASSLSAATDPSQASSDSSSQQSPLASAQQSQTGVPGAPSALPGSPLHGISDRQISILRAAAASDPEYATKLLNAQGALNYAQSGNVNDLKQYNPAAFASLAKATNDMSNAQKTNLATIADATGRIANAASLMPQGPQRDAYVRQSLQSVGAAPYTMNHLGNGPVTDQAIRELSAAATNTKDYFEVSGVTAGNVARAQLPSELAKIGATGAQARQTQAAEPRIVPPGGALVNPPPTSPGASPGQLPPIPPQLAAQLATPAGAPGQPPAAPAGPSVAPLAGGGSVVSNPNSPAMINLNQGNVPKYNEVTGEKVANFIADKQAQVAGAGQALHSIDELRGALNNLPTGPGTESLNDVSSILQRTGIDINKVLPDGWQTDPTKASIAQKNITQLAAAYAKSEFPSRITNNDMQIAMQATPNLWNNPQANKILLDNLDAVQRVKLDEAKFYRQDAASFGPGTAPDWTMIDRWNQHLENLPGVPDSIKRSYQSYSDLASNPNPPAAQQMNLPDGAISAAAGPNNHTVYLFKGPQGYIWSDKAP